MSPTQETDLYEKVGKLFGMVEQMDSRLDRVLANHEERINNSERCIDQLVGKSTVIGAICGLVGAGIVSVFIKLIEK